MKPVSIVSCTVILSVIALILFCGELPSNPIQDPNNADVRFFTESKNPSVAPGGSLKIGMEVTLPQHVSFIKVTSSCQNVDTLMEPESDSVRDTVFLYPEFAESGSCTLFVVATPYKASKKYDTLVVHVFEEESAIWNKEEETLTAIEGEKIKHDLEPYLTESDGITLSTNRGTISGTVWEWTPRYGSDTSETATVTAKKDGETMTFTLELTVSPGDTTAPVLTLVDDTLDGTTVDSSRIIVACTAIDEEAGVDKVFFTFGTDTVEASLQEDDRYSGEISRLARGVPTEITITAIDKSMKRNRSRITFTVTVDSMVSDTSPDTGNAPVITKNLDESLKVNEGKTLELTISASGTPEPTYQWYKDDELINDETDAELRIATVTESDAGVYHVVVSNGVGGVTSSSKATVTIALKVKITKEPSSATANEGEDMRFTVEATGETPSYQWLENGMAIKGATEATYTIPGVTTGDDGKKFTCEVSNTFSTTTSSEVFLTVITKLEYTVIFDCDGGEGTACGSEQKVKEDGIATKPSTEPTKTGYAFTGWYSPKEASTAFNFSTAITGNTTIYAKWTPVSSTVKFDLQDGNFLTPEEIAYGEKITEPTEPKRTGYTFEGWFKESSCITEWNFSTMTVTGVMTLYAKWVKEQCSITFDGQGATTPPNPTSRSIDISGAIGSMPTDPTRTSYFFDGWYTGTNGTGSRVTSSTTFSANATVYAKWIIKDIDNNLYTEVKIGDQVWMVENLKVTKYNDGTAIPNIEDSIEWSNLETGAYCWYNNEIISKSIFGGLYNWHAVNTGKLTPAGWHVPTISEMETLLNYLIVSGYNYDGTTEENKVAKSLTSEIRGLWETSTYEGSPGYQIETNNKSGFTGEPGGYRVVEPYQKGIFTAKGSQAYWWSSTQSTSFDGTYGYALRIESYLTGINIYWDFNKRNGVSVRCLRD